MSAGVGAAGGAPPRHLDTRTSTGLQTHSRLQPTLHRVWYHNSAQLRAYCLRRPPNRGAAVAVASGGGGQGPAQPPGLGGDGGDGDGSQRRFWIYWALGLGLLCSQTGVASWRWLSRALSSLGDLDEDDVRSLKRIVRDVLKDLVHIRARIKAVEDVSGMGPGGAASNQGQALVTGCISTVAGAAWTPGLGSSELPCGAGLGTDAGPLLELTVSGKLRRGLDAVQLVTESRAANGSIRFKRLMYRVGCFPFLNVIVAALGARGEDVAFTLNPFAGCGLGTLTSAGSPLHQTVLGSGIGAAMASPGLWCSFGAFSPPGHAPQGSVTSPSTGARRPDVFGQVAVSLGESVTAGCAVLARQGAPRESVGLLTCRPRGRAWVGHGWALQKSARDSELVWGISGGPYPNDSRSGWVMAASGMSSCGWVPRRAELAWYFNLGDGLTATPGIIVENDDANPRVSLAMKTCWKF